MANRDIRMLNAKKTGGNEVDMTSIVASMLFDSCVVDLGETGIWMFMGLSGIYWSVCRVVLMEKVVKIWYNLLVKMEGIKELPVWMLGIKMPKQLFLCELRYEL